MGVLVVDDQPLIRLALRHLLKHEEGLQVVGEASDAEAALALAEAVRPDVALVEPGADGGSSDDCLCRRMKGLSDPPRVLIYTASNSHQDVYACYLAGADGFVHKGEEPHRLVDAVRQALRGKRVWLLGGDPEETRPEPGPGSEAARLTAKEQEVLALMLKGLTNRRISEALCVGLETVKTHVRGVYRKLGVSGREELFASHRVRGL